MCSPPGEPKLENCTFVLSYQTSLFQASNDSDEWCELESGEKKKRVAGERERKERDVSCLLPLPHSTPLFCFTCSPLLAHKGTNRDRFRPGDVLKGILLWFHKLVCIHMNVNRAAKQLNLGQYTTHGLKWEK